MAEDLGEKTEDPTGKKLSDARSRGKIAKSKDLSGAIDLIAAALVLAMLGTYISGEFADLMTRTLGSAPVGQSNPFDYIAPALHQAARSVVVTVGPVMVLMFVVILIAHFAQVGPLFTTKPVTPDLNRLNPISGVKRIVSLRGIMQTLMSIAKLSVVGTIVVLVIMRNEIKLVRLPLLTPGQATMVTIYVLIEILAWVLAILLVIGVIDYLYQKWQHKKDLRMTKQEVKDEVKSLEGDPELKRRRFRMAQEVAMQRVNTEVPDADVIVTNPTHFSVAIRYKNEWGAPRVVAKGADQIAMRIRFVAMANGVPIVERPPLARALYWGTKEGDLISEEHYEAVAEILAYVYRLDGRAASMKQSPQPAMAN
ncbi:MAG: flagellar biosynthesis protein FlhB [Phycisphaerales bacterium JB061]